MERERRLSLFTEHSGGAHCAVVQGCALASSYRERPSSDSDLWKIGFGATKETLLQILMPIDMEPLCTLMRHGGGEAKLEGVIMVHAIC